MTTPGTLSAAKSWRPAGILVLLTCLLVTANCHALGLGRVAGEAILGEALQVEVPLIGSIDRALDDSCISASQALDSIDAEYFPRDLKLRLDRQNGSPRLLVFTRSALRQPLVEFRILVACGYNLSHDYLLMVSPRRERSQTAAPTAPRPPAAAAVAQANRPLPDGLTGREFVVEQGMDLEDLGRLHYPGPLRRERFMRWVVEANPQLFAGATNLRRHRLAPGTRLLIPEGVPPRRPGDHKDGSAQALASAPLAPMAAKTSPPPRASRPTPAAREVRASQPDRLVVGGAGGQVKDFKETMALVERLTGMLEQQLAAQAAGDEKMRRLEVAMTDLSKYVVQLETLARQRESEWQAERQTARRAEAEQAERGWWQLLIAILAGGGLGAGLMQLQRRLPLRREPAETDLPAAAPVAVAPAPEAAAPAAAVVAPPLPAMAPPPPPPAPASVPPSLMPSPFTPPVTPSPAPAVTAFAAEPASPVPPASTPTLVTRERLPREPMFDSASIDFELPPLSESEVEPPPRPEKPLHFDEIYAAINPAAIAEHEPADVGLVASTTTTPAPPDLDVQSPEALARWLELVAEHRQSGDRGSYERSAAEVNKHFNVAIPGWDEATEADGRKSLEDYTHIRDEIICCWPHPQCAHYLYTLLTDNRDGTRAGFPLGVAEDILLLMALLNEHP